MATDENAMEAFAGESQANRKYAAFAEKADSEGYMNIGRLFKAASEAEAIHAKKLLKAMGMIGSTTDNLEKAVAGETYEFTEMYPKFVKEAEEEKKSDVLLAFNYLNSFIIPPYNLEHSAISDYLPPFPTTT